MQQLLSIFPAPANPVAILLHASHASSRIVQYPREYMRIQLAWYVNTATSAA